MVVCKQPRQGPQRDSCPGEREPRLHTAVRLCPSRGLGTHSRSDYRPHPAHQQKLLGDNTGKAPCGLVWLHLTNTWCDSTRAQRAPGVTQLKPNVAPDWPPNTTGTNTAHSRQTAIADDRTEGQSGSATTEAVCNTHRRHPTKHQVPVSGTRRAGHYRTSSSEGHYF